MKRVTFSLGLVAAGLALTAMPVLAGQRPNEGGSPAADRGTAVDRPATSGNTGGSGAASSGGGSAVSGFSSVAGGGSSVTSSPSAGGAASPSFSSADRSAPAMAEPQHRRPSGGESGNRGGDRAVPRGTGSSASSGTSRTGGSPTTASSSGGNNNNASEGNHERAVPSWSRPRGDRPSTGTAVERTTPPYRGGGGGYFGRYYDPYFGFGYPGYGYGFGLGLGFYDPWFGDPFGYGLYGPGYGGYGYSGYGSGYYPYTSGAQGYGSSTGEEGAVRLKIKPRDAKVYVDGYFVGTVDDFDGTFQKLKIGAGRHHFEVKADGYTAAEFDVLVAPDQTLIYQGELKRIQ